MLHTLHKPMAARLDNARGVAAIAESEARLGRGRGAGDLHT
jgi:hypothetical protein